MSGSPTEAEVQTQWRAAVNMLEKLRNYADGTMAGAGNLIQTLIDALEGEYTPDGLTAWAASHRAGISDLLSQESARTMLEPILFEYARLFTDGSGYRDVDSIWRALYEHFVENSLTVSSRAITYMQTETYDADNVGGGSDAELTRLAQDENDQSMEACTVETKLFRCRRDQNSGVDEHAEVFEVIGDASSRDNLLRSSFGSGIDANVTIRSHHAGTGVGNGGSLLRNASYADYPDGATPEFSGWTASGAGAASISQDTTDYYRTFPNASTNGSLKMTGGAGDILLTQTLADMSTSSLNPDTPYFLRVMLNKTEGTADGGTVTLTLGSKTAAITIAALGANWQELRIGNEALDGAENETDCWFRKFNQDDFSVSIGWASSTSGDLLVDDIIFCPWDLVDGTYWMLRQDDDVVAPNHPPPWVVDDKIYITDTGGAPATGKIQWWNYVSGLGYLPSTTTGSETFAEPS